MPLQNTSSLKVKLVDIFNQTISPSVIEIENNFIKSISPSDDEMGLPYALPGFVDAHVHIESSMLLPSEFAKLAVVHGTVATVSDPHEIANVLGVTGVEYMIGNAKQVPFHCCFGAPSCVPATVFETAGASIDAEQVKLLLQKDDIYYLSEMMNFPGVLNADEEVLKKIKYAHELQKPIDGHAPGLRGEAAAQYIAAGISTDHECFTKEEALDKLKYGMKILIREGSAAKNFDALVDLIDDFPTKIMFCSDDKHPDSLVTGHINELVKRAVALGKPLFNVLQAACINPVLHYNLPIGLLRVGDAADFILVKDLQNFEVLKTFVNGNLVAENGDTKIETVASTIINQFNCEKINEAAIKVKATSAKIKVIEALNGQLITNTLIENANIQNGFIASNLENDILKIVVLNRYHNAPPAVAFIKNFGLKHGAIASTVAHDSHNIIAVGTSDAALCKVINDLIEQKGGVNVFDGEQVFTLPLPVAGLMSNKDGYEIAAAYSSLDKKAKALGSKLDAPFMTLSFMALLVIPSIKLSDKGLFDGERFAFTTLAEEKSI